VNTPNNNSLCYNTNKLNRISLTSITAIIGYFLSSNNSTKTLKSLPQLHLLMVYHLNSNRFSQWITNHVCHSLRILISKIILPWITIIMFNSMCLFLIIKGITVATVLPISLVRMKTMTITSNTNHNNMQSTTAIIIKTTRDNLQVMAIPVNLPMQSR